MKVIGTANGSDYIVQVSHSELEKVMGKYYGKMPNLKVGDEMNLGTGYNFTSDIQKACGEMTDAMKAFKSAQETMRSFALMVSALPEPEITAE